MINFAIVGNQEVLHVFSWDENTQVGERWVAAMRSGAKLIKIEGYKFKFGDIFKDGIVYRKNDNEELQELELSTDIADNIVGFAGLIDDEIVGGIIVNRDIFGEDNLQRLQDVINSDHEIIESPVEVGIGWIYNGEGFLNPESGE